MCHGPWGHGDMGMVREASCGLDGGASKGKGAGDRMGEQAEGKGTEWTPLPAGYTVCVVCVRVCVCVCLEYVMWLSGVCRGWVCCGCRSVTGTGGSGGDGRHGNQCLLPARRTAGGEGATWGHAMGVQSCAARERTEVIILEAVRIGLGGVYRDLNAVQVVRRLLHRIGEDLRVLLLQPAEEGGDPHRARSVLWLWLWASMALGNWFILRLSCNHSRRTPSRATLEQMGGASSTPASVAFIGLPASGKSSLVCTIADAAEKRKEPLRSADAYGDFLSHATQLGTHFPTTGLAHLELVVKSSGGTLHLSEQGGGTDQWRRQMNQMMLKKESTTCCCFVVDASLRDTRAIQEARTLLRALARDAPASVLFVVAATKSDVEGCMSVSEVSEAYAVADAAPGRKVAVVATSASSGLGAGELVKKFVRGL